VAARLSADALMRIAATARERFDAHRRINA
jgi:hypothetical protein